jgi:hypothetical protein
VNKDAIRVEHSTKIVFSFTSFQESHSYFKNEVGHLLAHPLGDYVAADYYAGPRQPADSLRFLSHAGQLLARWGWEKLFHQRGEMAPVTPAEIAWVRACWDSPAQERTLILYGALLLPHDAFASLCWRGGKSGVIRPLQ